MLESEQEYIKKGKKVPKRKDNYLPPQPEPVEGERKTVEIQEGVPEPDHDFLSGNEDNFDLHISANVDAARYECETKKIEFKPTMMYTSRVYSFKVKNISLIAMPFKWQFVDRQGEEDDGYYSISPCKGKIAP